MTTFLPRFIFRSPLYPVSGNDNAFAFSEALYLSTPVLYEEYRKHLKHTLQHPKELKKLQISLYKYQTRASNRCTPFGLFAGLGTGTWGHENKILSDADLTQSLKRKTRLDMNVVCTLAQELSKQPFIRRHLKFFPNNSIYLVGNSYRYVEYYYSHNRRFHKLNRVDVTSYLDSILKEAKAGLTEQQLSLLLTNDEISQEEAAAFITELTEAQLLISQLDPTVTGEDFFQVLLTNLQSIYQKEQTAELNTIISLLEEIDGLIRKNDDAILNDPETYQFIYLKLKEILPDLGETNLFQTDLYKQPLSASMSGDLQAKLSEVIGFLNKITPPAANSRMDDFKKRFYERYEETEIPFLLALDTETGIGYPSVDANGINELVEDVLMAGTNGAFDIKWNDLQSVLLKLLTESIRTQKKAVQISEEDFKQVDYSAGNMPHSYTVMFKVIDAETNRLAIDSIGGSSAINLLGRFAGGDQQLCDMVKEIAAFEQQQMPDKLLAEIVHLPESRTGNILARPNYRSYEIPYLAKSSVSSEFQLHPESLTLKIRNDRIILYDTVRQCEVVPRLGNAHNFSTNSLPVYHFLCDLQTQYFAKSYLGFNWGSLAMQFGFLPRVEYRNCILSPAKWQISKSDLAPLQDKGKSDGEKHRLFAELKQQKELPDQFVVADGDNELLIDCENPLAIDTFIDVVKNRSSVSLEEYLFTGTNALVKDTAGHHYTNECLAIVLNEATAPAVKLPAEDKLNNKRQFAIGSEWLFYKIYCGAKTSDLILTEHIREFTGLLKEQGIIDQWFFIRYADPQTHLRLRLHITDMERYGEVLRTIHESLEPLMDQNLVSKLQTDTYKRELERYGDNSIQLAEELFHHDSVFVTDMLSLLDADSGGEIRWQIAIRSVDDYLDDFGLSFGEKQELITNLGTAFGREHGINKEMKVALDSKFRKLKAKVEQVLNREKDVESDYYPIIGLIGQRSAANKPTIEKLHAMKAGGHLQKGLNDLLGSLLHMNLDRLFMGRNRTNEFIVYDLLHRHYKGVAARQLKSQKNTLTEKSDA